MALKVRRAGPASGKARSLVVLLHGYGADGADLIGLAEPLAGVLPDTLFLSPDAPEPCRVNPMGRQWFPISWIDGCSEAEMAAGVLRSSRLLDGWLTETMEAEGLGPEATALVGFSQGTMMSLHVALRRPEPLAAVVGFSGRLADAPEQAASTPPVLLVHGDMDEVIPVAALTEARNGLAALGAPVEWHVSRGVGHGIAPDGLRLCAQFLRARL
jgi:phospholipase/carboxylesterase